MFVHCVQKKNTHLCFIQYFRVNIVDCCENFSVCLGDIDETIYVKVKYFLNIKDDVSCTYE